MKNSKFEKIIRKEEKEMNFHESFDNYLKDIASSGRDELKRKYLVFLSGDESNGLPWQWIKEMLDRGYITQEDMNYIVD